MLLRLIHLLTQHRAAAHVHLVDVRPGIPHGLRRGAGRGEGRAALARVVSIQGHLAHQIGTGVGLLQLLTAEPTSRRPLGGRQGHGRRCCVDVASAVVGAPAPVRRLRLQAEIFHGLQRVFRAGVQFGNGGVRRGGRSADVAASQGPHHGKIGIHFFQRGRDRGGAVGRGFFGIVRRHAPRGMPQGCRWRLGQCALGRIGGGLRRGIGIG
mmetsp:Transcript_35972/g.75736  ORF Transcript_35972/g.75736 Transcript_35972/m.75736 type:complete len:210 (-) Transcript_35972:1041-1670(-)